MPMNNMAGPIAGAWPEAHVDELKALCADGKLSYREIADVISRKFETTYTKNAIIGKVQRVGITKVAVSQKGLTKARPKKATTRTAPRKRIATFLIVPANGNSNAMRVIKTVSFALEKLRCVEVSPRNIGLLDLEPNDCRYPTSDDLPHLFCGHPKADGSSYCGAHTELCSQAPRIPIHRFARVAA